MTTMEGGEPVIDWPALAPHIAHPTREAIIEAILRIGEPLGVADHLVEIFRDGDPDLNPSRVFYYVETLVAVAVLTNVAEHVSGAALEPLYALRTAP